MKTLNKQELKQVTGGLTLIEYGLLTSLSSILLEQGFDSGPVSEFVNAFTALPEDVGISDLNVFPDNPLAFEIAGIKLVKVELTDGSKLLLTDKNFVHAG